MFNKTLQKTVDGIIIKMIEYQLESGLQYTVSDNAPDTFERLKAESTPTRLVVWSGASESSIWGLEGNYLFRAIHDSIHLQFDLSFDDMHEAEVCYITCKLLGLNEVERNVMVAEIIGQLEYKNAHGDFPADQREFIQTYLKEA